jgi:hypothetical protein
VATEADRKDKPASTIVLVFVGSVSFTELGGRIVRVRNRSCNLTKYISFGAQTHQGFGHPKEFCNTNPVCAVCAGDHLTSKHECPQKSCRGGYRCIHSIMKCANCKDPHRASNRNCPERIKRTQEFREMVRLRKTRTTPELELFPSIPAEYSPNNLIESNFNNLFNTNSEILHNNLPIPSRPVINNIYSLKYE